MNEQAISRVDIQKFILRILMWVSPAVEVHLIHLQKNLLE